MKGCRLVACGSTMTAVFQSHTFLRLSHCHNVRLNSFFSVWVIKIRHLVTGECIPLHSKKRFQSANKATQESLSLLPPPIKSKDESAFQSHFFGNAVSEFTRCECCVESKYGMFS